MTYYGKQPPWPWPPEPPKPPNPPKPEPDACPQEPGTVLRISIPAGADINLANLLEISAPTGICLLVRIPTLGGALTEQLINAVKQAGGSVEFE
ncbi:MAG: hypothetical protein FH749_14185 [Firmicutes bacterium]|nr:hypothetical protein [Bacillota bacterium]